MTEANPNRPVWGAIWIGRRRTTSEAYRRVHVAFPILDAAELPAVIDEKAPSPNSQTTAFTIGELYVFAFSSLPKIATGWDWRTAPRARNRLERIVPEKYTAIFWSPPILTDNDASDFSHAFLRYNDDLAKRKGYR